MTILKRILKGFFRLFGINVTRYTKIEVADDLDLYKRLYSSDILSKKPFYNIGAGSFSHTYWTNIDFSNSWYNANNENMNISYNLMELKKLPVDDNTAEIVYSSHTMEHITDVAVNNIVAESYRILKPGGTIRLTAPDINLYYNTFINNDIEFFRDSIAYYSQRNIMDQLELNSMKESTIGSLFLYYFAASTSPLTKYSKKKKFNDKKLHEIFESKTFSEALNYICSFCFFDPDKSGYHINWVNSDKFIRILKEAGFSNIYVSAYGQSRNPVLRNLNYFDNTVPEVSCYIEAIK